MNKSDLQIIKKWKLQNLKIGMCHGVFDLIHIGHLEHFEEIRKNFAIDKLVVSITDDKYVNKGPGRPIYSTLDRIKFLKNLKYIDLVVVSKNENAVNNILLIKPNYYFKGPDYLNLDRIDKNLEKEIRALKQCHGKIRFTKKIKKSSSAIINNYSESYNKYFLDWLYKNITKDDLIKIISMTKKIKHLKISIFGDSVLDQYNMIKPLEKSAKEPLIVFEEGEILQYLGGSYAVFRNILEFNENILLNSYIPKFLYSLIPKKLRSNIYIDYKDSTTFHIKKRYVNINNWQTIFYTSKKIEDEFRINKFKSNQSFETLIILDYGLGYVEKNLSKIKNIRHKNLVLNQQLNSSTVSNNSFDLVKILKPNVIFINQNELLKNHKLKIYPNIAKMKKYAKTLNCNLLVITLGQEGVLIVDKTEQILFCPALGSLPVDKVGAGDSLLSIISLYYSFTKQLKYLALVGNILGDFSIKNIGNSKSMTIQQFQSKLEYFMHYTK